MKQLNNFLNEALIKKNTKILHYHFYPKDFHDLRKIIIRLLKERGPDADLNDIDISQVTTFCNDISAYHSVGLFEELDPHNIKINKWDISHITDLRRTFFGCHRLNCNLSNWDLSRYSGSLSNMFYECYEFEGHGLENWNISNVTSLFGMFVKCRNLNVNLSDWKPIECTSIAHMFNGCKIFDCDLSSWGAYLKNIDESHYMFEDCTTLLKKELIPEWYFKL